MRTGWAFLVVALLTAGCAGTGTTVEPNYVFSLDQVDLREEGSWSDYTITERDTAGGVRLVYRDSVLSARFFPSEGVISSRFRNETDLILRVQLQDGLYVGSQGSPQRLVTGEMSYAMRNSSPRPLILPSGASDSVVLIPYENVIFDERRGVVITRWLVLPNSVSSIHGAERAESNVGKSFQLILPVRVKGEVRQYTFTFKVEGAGLPPARTLTALFEGEVVTGLEQRYVREIKGEPNATRQKNGQTIWYYGTVTDRTRIIFEEGKVVKIQ